MNFDNELAKIGMSPDDYQACLNDIADKVSGEQDLEWTEIKEKYNLPYSPDVIRKANNTLFGGAAVRHFIKRDDPVNTDSAIAAQMYKLKKEKQKLSDERTALNKMAREEGRLEQDIELLREQIGKYGAERFPNHSPVIRRGDNDLIVCVSDFHFGQDVDSFGGKYNAEIAKQRLDEYMQEIVNIAMLHGSENLYICLLGDLISGNLHLTTRLDNRENVVEQVMRASELLTTFVYELSKEFLHVYVTSVVGNHSRIGLKDEVLRNERLDLIIPWYMESALSANANVHFLTDEYDTTIRTLTVRGHEYWLVHGDFDSFSKSGLSKLALMVGHIPYAVFMGHMHHCSFDEVDNVLMIRSGSLCGTGDDYTMSKRLKNNPSQMVCVADDDGIRTMYPVILH